LRGASATEGGTRRLDVWLAWVQDLLFNLGSELATPGDQRLDGMPVVDGADVSSLERAIDEAQAELKPLANFIHPGGSPPGAYLHVARTVCRRAERLLVAMRDHGDADISPAAIAYLNRLSDALFVWARWVNARLSSDEHIWNKASRRRRRLSGSARIRARRNNGRGGDGDRIVDLTACGGRKRLRAFHAYAGDALDGLGCAIRLFQVRGEEE